MTRFWRDFSDEIGHLSIKEKTYTIAAGFLLLSATLIGFSIYAIRQQTHYHDELSIASRGAVNLERANGLIYAVVMESRGIYMSTNPDTVKVFANSLQKRIEELAATLTDWQSIVRGDDELLFGRLRTRMLEFIQFRGELVRRATEIGAAAGREWGDNDANRSIRAALNADLLALGQLSGERATRIGELGTQAHLTVFVLLLLGLAEIVLAALAVLAIKRCLIEPIYAITATTDGIVTGKISLIIPYAARVDEIGTLARAIRDMQNLMVRTNLQKAHHARLDERDSLGAKLEITKAELGAALNNMDQGLIMLDARANVILVNQQYKKMYGLTDEMVHPGRSLRDLVKVRTERGLLTGGIDDYLSVIKARIVTGEASVNEIELSDGRTIRVFERPMATGGWVATHEDFTEHRRLQRSLERTERFLVSVIENVREAVVAKDARSLRYIFVNRAAESLFGIPRSKIVGRTPREIFGPELADQIERSDAVMLRADAQPQTDLRTMETPGNGRRRMSFRRLPLSGQAGSHFLLTLIDDKTVEVATGISTPEAA